MEYKLIIYEDEFQNTVHSCRSFKTPDELVKHLSDHVAAHPTVGEKMKNMKNWVCFMIGLFSGVSICIAEDWWRVVFSVIGALVYIVVLFAWKDAQPPVAADVLCRCKQPGRSLDYPSICPYCGHKHR